MVVGPSVLVVNRHVLINQIHQMLDTLLYPINLFGCQHFCYPFALQLRLNKSSHLQLKCEKYFSAKMYAIEWCIFQWFIKKLPK